MAVKDTKSHRLLGLVVLGGALSAGSLQGGGLPTGAATSPWLTQYGSGSATGNGDYVSASAANGGLHSSYNYYIEVPSGLARLVVQVFDADIGLGAFADLQAGGTWNTAATYTLSDPGGVVRATSTGNAAGPAGSNDAWVTLYNATTPAAGHWHLVVDTSASAGEDNDGYGVRANDGNFPSLTELNVYLDSEVLIGVTSALGSHANYTLYPYVTSGCSFEENDFDMDNDTDTNPAQSIVFTSPGHATGGTKFTQTVSAALSVNGVWASTRIPTTGIWTTASDNAAIDYGIWTDAIQISQDNGTGNYGDLFVGNFLSTPASTTAPTASPQANSFRLYLPTDAGAAPVKPYLEQLLTWVSGPQTPTVGQATTLSVTVRVVNPTTHSITFGGAVANVVTVNVPGPTTAVTYQGNPQVSQGSVTGAPAIGNIGNVVWNPGAVAAGATALLSFNTKITPTAAGQRIPVTGVVSTGTGATGTTAVFVDETGDTTAGHRATFTLGPICELAATVANITPAVVAGVKAHAVSGKVVVEWETASEVGTAGFDLLRWDPEQKEYLTLNRHLLTGLQGAPQGGRYRFIDEGASPQGTYYYAFREATASGEPRIHGPYAVQVDGEAGPDDVPLGEFDRAPRAPSKAASRAFAMARQAIPVTPIGARPASLAPAMEIGVQDSGLYFLSTSSIAAGLSIPEARVNSLMRAQLLSLTSQGKGIAWMGVPGGMEFYGTAINSIYTTDNVYWLRQGPGLVMATVDGGDPKPASVALSFPDQVHAEQNLLAATVVATDPNSDYWYWDFLSGGDPEFGQKTFPVTVPAPDPSGSLGHLWVHLQSATTTGVPDEHHAVVSLNGTEVGEVQWQGIAAATLDVQVNPALIKAGANSVTIEALLNSGVPYSIFYLDSIDIAYDHLYQAEGSAFAFKANGQGTVTVTGFPASLIGVYDITDPARPRHITRTAVGGRGPFTLSFVPSGPVDAYWAGTQSAVKMPKWTHSSAPTLRSSAQGGEYLVLTSSALLEPARRLAALRERKGLSAVVVDVNDIMGEFNSGISDPRAITAFLQWASVHWNPAPRLVVLAGAGNFDYKNYLGYGGNLVPPLMVSTPSGLFASDNAFVDLNGDGVPDLSVGRIPALTASELDAYVTKIEGYEMAQVAGWDGNALWLADTPSAGGDFAGQAESLVPGLPNGYSTTRVYLTDETVVQSHAQLLADINSGASLMNYVGHGGLDRLSSDGLLLSTDIPSLQNGSRLPLLTALTCVINRFEVPGFSPLGAELVKSPVGGASAVWAPTGLSVDQDALALGRMFYLNLSSSSGAFAGDLIRQALASYGGSGRNPTLSSVYNLLGDPALVVKTPDVTTPPQGPGGTWVPGRIGPRGVAGTT